MIYIVGCILAGAFLGALAVLIVWAFVVAVETLVEVHHLAAKFRRMRRETNRGLAPAETVTDPGTTQPEYDALFAQITDCPINEQHRNPHRRPSS